MARLPVYLRILYDLAADRVGSVSSERLAELAGVSAAKVRKDLSYLGSYGTRGVGYEVDYLTYQMSRELGLTHDWPVVIVGAGNLGQALANYAASTSEASPSRRWSTSIPPRWARPSATSRSGTSTNCPASWATEAASGSSPRRPERLRARRTGSSVPA